MHKRILVPTAILVLTLSLTLSLLVDASVARAAAARPPTAAAADPFDQNDPSAKEPYRKAIKYGVAEYDAQRFEEALGYFRRAHQLYPNARTLRGIGMTAFELRDYVTAVRNLTAAIDDARKPLSAAQRKETQDLIDRCQNFIGVYRLVVSPPGAQVTIDGQAPELQPDGTVMLGLGTHPVEGRAKGHNARKLSVQVRGGERQELVVSLDPVSTVAPAVPVAASRRSEPVITVPARPSAIDNKPAKVWLWTGGSLAVLSIGSAYFWIKQSNALADCHNPPDGFGCDNEPRIKLERNLAAAGTIVTGAAALAAVTVGILSWKTARSRTADGRALACTVGLSSLVCGGSF